MKQTLTILLGGGVGGISPLLYTKAVVLMNNGATIFTPGLWIGIGFFFLLGATVSWYGGADTRKEAFLLGLAFPAFIAHAFNLPAPSVDGIVMGIAPEPEPVLDDRTELGHGGESAASLGLTFEGVSPCPNGELRFYEGTRELGAVEFVESCNVHAQKPDEATYFRVWTDRANPGRWYLSGDGMDEYSLRYSYDLWKDIRSGLGNASVRPYNLELTPVGDTAKGS